jgi:hypothetical protein
VDANAGFVPYYLRNTVSYLYDVNGAITHTKSLAYDTHHAPDGVYEQDASYKGNKLIFVKAGLGYSIPNCVRTINYQANDHITVDSFFISNGWDPLTFNNQTTYVYDGADNWIQSHKTSVAYPNNYSRVNSYYPDGKLRTSRYYKDSALQGIDSFTYAPGVPGYFAYYKTTVGASLDRYQEVCVHITADSLKDSIIVSEYHDTTLYSERAWKIVYNAMRNPVSKIQSAPNGIGVHQEIVHWYYESYDPSLSTHEVLENTSGIFISPNPISSTLILHYPTTLPKERLHVVISNTAGQLVHSESFVPQGSKTDIVLGDELAPGVYAIAVYGGGNAVLYRGAFLKQ